MKSRAVMLRAEGLWTSEAWPERPGPQGQERA
jgi:hypothetical protein